MGDVQSLPTAESPAPVLQQSKATVHSLDSIKCGLCGTSLGAKALRYRVVSPLRGSVRLTVCLTCRKVAPGEGYRPLN